MKGTTDICGMFLDSNDKENLASNIEEALEFFHENKEYIQEWGDNCRKVILEEITWKKWEDKIFQFFVDRIEECR